MESEEGRCGMKDRYHRNMNMLSPEENESLRSFRICVIGCGGLGGYVIELLGRLGIGIITAVDGDVFEPTNLNRQLFSTEEEMGKSKAFAAEERMKKVNSEVTVHPIRVFVTEENCAEIIKDHDLVVDALDNMAARRLLEVHCEKQRLPLIHGAIAGWYGQVSTILPGDGTLQKIYPSDENKGAEAELGNPSFSPALVASIQVAEALKVLLHRGEILQNKLLTIDLLNQEYEIFEL
ncbi:MAG: HesA/MoeB/ThiF family protein [Eubacteriales bacterium]|nr:HesA/MoeB/ThiF family protein [Eubacteriales bacterium]